MKDDGCHIRAVSCRSVILSISRGQSPSSHTLRIRSRTWGWSLEAPGSLRCCRWQRGYWTTHMMTRWYVLLLGIFACSPLTRHALSVHCERMKLRPRALSCEQSQVSLVFANVSEQDILLKDKIDEMQARHPKQVKSAAYLRGKGARALTRLIARSSMWHTSSTLRLRAGQDIVDGSPRRYFTMHCHHLESSPRFLCAVSNQPQDIFSICLELSLSNKWLGRTTWNGRGCLWAKGS